MNSRALSIVWELLARNRWATAFVGLSFPIAYLTNLLWPNLAKSAADGTTGGIFMPFEFIAFLLSFATLFWLFSYAEHDRRGRYGGFPSHMFVLPTRTFQLVSIPVVVGLLSVILYYCLWAGVIYPQWGVTLSQTLFRNHVLTFAAMLLVVQAIAWSLHAFPWVQRCLILGGLVGLGFVGIPESEAHKVSPNSVSVSLVVLIFLAWIGAIAGVARDRCGNWEGWTGKVLQRLCDVFPGRTRSFPSPAQAQFWIEWQRHGLIAIFLFVLPVTVSLVLFLLPSSLVLYDARAGFIFFGPALLALIMASTMGGTIAKMDFWSPRFGFTSFAATRPVATGEFLMAKIKVVTLVIGVGWVVIIALAPLAFNAPRFVLPDEFPLPTWTEIKEHFPQLSDLLSTPVLYVAILVLTWHSAVSGLSIGLLARPNKVLPLSGLALLIFIFVITAGGWLLQHPQFHAILFPPLIWVALGLALLKLLMTYQAFRATHSESLFTASQFVAAVSFWAIAVAGILAGGWLLHSMEILPDPLLLFLVAYFLPGPELPNCALHMAKDRHR